MEYKFDNPTNNYFLAEGWLLIGLEGDELQVRVDYYDEFHYEFRAYGRLQETGNE